MKDRDQLLALPMQQRLSGKTETRRAASLVQVFAPIRQGRTGPTGVLIVAFPDDPGPMIDLVEAAAILAGLILHLREEVETANEHVRASKAMGSAIVPPTLDELLDSESLRPLRADIDVALLGDSPLLILGESGTGKTQLATAIAHASGRVPVVRAVLGASHDLNTITSELFGHERGAFSGAVSKRRGLVEYADGGTLILDEILDLPPNAQQLLLDFTQFGTYRPLGYQGSEPKRSKVRIIAATNGNIIQAIRDTRFRQDLFFRLAALRVEMPPLRERRQDIVPIAESYLRRLDPIRGWTLTEGARMLISSEHLEWAGNVRQLEGALRRARDSALVAGSVGGELTVTHLSKIETQGSMSHYEGPKPRLAPTTTLPAPSSEIPQHRTEIRAQWDEVADARTRLDADERMLIEAALREAEGNAARAARALGLSRTSLLSRKNTLGVDLDLNLLRPGRQK